MWHPAFDSSTNTGGGVGGWETSELRSYLASKIKPLLPENVASNIKAVQKAFVALDASLKKYEGECKPCVILSYKNNGAAMRNIG